MHSLRRLWCSSPGQKALLALSGLWLLGWLTLHMAGNLLIFSGADAIDGYSASLRRLPALLWAVRALTLGALVLHVCLVVSLWKRSARARGERGRQHTRGATLASLTMRAGGLALLAFLVLHLLHLTFGALHPAFDPARVHDNLVLGLASPWVALAYAAAALVLGLHVWHGVWATALSLGLRTSAPGRRRPLALLVAALLATGFAIVPLAVALGVVR